jgi:hypothetical protein
MTATGCNKSPVTTPNGLTRQKGKFCFRNIACYDLLRRRGNACGTSVTCVTLRCYGTRPTGRGWGRNITWPPLRGGLLLRPPNPAASARRLLLFWKDGRSDPSSRGIAAPPRHEVLARDTAVAASFCLQFGCDVEILSRALMRVSHERGSSPVGAPLDLLASETRLRL